MTSLLDKIKYGIDTPSWMQMNPLLNAHAAGGCICSDKRNDISSYDAIFQLASATVLNVTYGPPNGSGFLVNPGISAFGAGSAIVFVPSMTYVGTIAAGSTTTSIVSATNLGSTIAKNGFVLSEGIGFKIRIHDNAAGASGKTIERFIVGNTESATPTIYVNASFGLVPTTGSSFEIIAGKIFCLGNGATAATQMRYYSVGAGTMTSCTGTGLTLATESSMEALDEQYVPYDRKPGEGFVVGSYQYDNYLTATTTIFDKYCLTATGSAEGSLTGQAAGGDFLTITNEYRNFQIRIVEDTAIPTAVGQRRLIASHTGSGVAPVYTLGSNWTVTPSTNAKYVIELPNQIILSTVAAGTATYVYNPNAYALNNATTTINANAWSTTYYGARSNAIAAGSMLIPAYGHQPTTSAAYTKLTRHSYIYSMRGASITLDLLDIAGGANGAWTNNIPYNAQGTSISTGSCGDYAPTDQQGRWFYFVINGSNLVYRLDVKYLSLYPWCNLPTQSGAAVVGKRIACTCWNNQQLGLTDKMTKIYAQGHLAATLYKSDVII